MNVLLAVDGSAYSTWAAKTLTALHLGPEKVVTVFSSIPEYTYLGGLTLDALTVGAAAKSKEQRRNAQEQKAKPLVQSAIAILQAAGIKAEGSVGRGKAAEEILRKADAADAGLIALGAKGKDNNDRFELGTVAHRVVKYAPCSVLLSRKRVNSPGRILLAADGSTCSNAASGLVLHLTDPAQWEILVITVLQSHIATWMKSPALDFDKSQQILTQLQKAEQEAAASLAHSTKKAFKQRGYRVSSMIRKGEPANEILAAASVVNPDLIVLGAKGLTGIERFLMGGVAQRVARYSKHSVLVVRQR